MRIAVLTPSRGRANVCARMCWSAHETAADPGSLECWVYIDDDDPKVQEYHGGLPAWVRRHVGPADGVGKAWNHLYGLCGADIVMMGNDDFVFQTPNWDDRVREAFSAYPDRILCAWPDDGINGQKQAALVTVSRKWCETLGYFVPEIFRFFRHDTWIYDIAKRIDRLCYLPEVIVKHEHFTIPGGVLDETTRRNRDSNQAQHDLGVWDDTVASRERAAEKLRSVMEKVKA